MYAPLPANLPEYDASRFRTARISHERPLALYLESERGYLLARRTEYVHSTYNRQASCSVRYERCY